MTTAENDLVRWSSRQKAGQELEFTEQGWALAEACARLNKYRQPQELIADMLGEILNGLIDEGAKSSGAQLDVAWQVKPDGFSAVAAFDTDALQNVSGICNMRLGELQIAVQESLEVALLDLYDEHKDKQRLH